jgi:hypothetical protein
MTIETTAETPAERSPWYVPSYAWVLLATLGLQVGLYLSQVFGVLGKGQAVLIAVAATAGIPLWVIACCVFRLKSQFGLRTLLLAVVVVAIPSGWMSRELERARNQRALVERFRIYNYLDGGPRLVPNWLRKSLGEDFFAELEGVGFDAPESGAGLAPLRGFTTLRSLYLRGTQVTDDGLANLREFTNLRSLDLSGTKITDSGLTQLRGLTNLQSLDLTGTKITDDGLANLRALTNLQTLYLYGAPVTEVGIAHLCELTNLKTLGLNGTQVTDAGLARLRELTNLSELSLNGTPVTDAGLAYIHKLTNLETLCLLGTRVTDDGLIHLRGLKNLQFLYLSGTPVTDDEVRQLQADLPECQMDR